MTERVESNTRAVKQAQKDVRRKIAGTRRRAIIAHLLWACLSRGVAATPWLRRCWARDEWLSEPRREPSPAFSARDRFWPRLREPRPNLARQEKAGAPAPPHPVYRDGGRFRRVRDGRRRRGDRRRGRPEILFRRRRDGQRQVPGDPCGRG